MAEGSGIWGWGHLPFRRLFWKKSAKKTFDGFDQRPAKRRKPLVSIEKDETENGFSMHVLHERPPKHFHDFHHRMHFYFDRLRKNQAYHDR